MSTQSKSIRSSPPTLCFPPSPTENKGHPLMGADDTEQIVGGARAVGLGALLAPACQPRDRDASLAELILSRAMALQRPQPTGCGGGSIRWCTRRAKVWHSRHASSISTRGSGSQDKAPCSGCHPTSCPMSPRFPLVPSYVAGCDVGARWAPRCHVVV